MAVLPLPPHTYVGQFLVIGSTVSAIVASNFRSRTFTLVAISSEQCERYSHTFADVADLLAGYVAGTVRMRCEITPIAPRVLLDRVLDPNLETIHETAARLSRAGAGARR